MRFTQLIFTLGYALISAPLATSSSAVELASLGPFSEGVDLREELRPATPVRFEMAMTAPAVLEVVDARGEIVKTVADGVWARGIHQLAWHHDDENGLDVADGIYTLRLRTVDPMLADPDAFLALSR